MSANPLPFRRQIEPDPHDVRKAAIEDQMRDEREAKEERNAAMIRLGGHPGQWAIEYEIPPLRAIYNAFVSSELSEQRTREEIQIAQPLWRIRRLFKIT